MAEYEIREGIANAFMNRDKKEDKHPDFKTQVFVDGKLKDIALWTRETKAGERYYGVKITEGKPREKKVFRQEPSRQSREETIAEQINDEIPF
jgi:uncharacterized protein (DUF736 family)